MNICPLYGYSPVNEKFICVVPPKGQNISLLAATTDENILGFMLFKGSVKANDYGAFLLQII